WLNRPERRDLLPKLIAQRGERVRLRARLLDRGQAVQVAHEPEQEHAEQDQADADAPRERPSFWPGRLAWLRGLALRACADGLGHGLPRFLLPTPAQPA